MKGVGIACVLIFGTIGCNSCGGAGQADNAESVPSTSESVPVGVIQGLVKLSTGAELPTYPPQRAVADRGLPEGCPPRQQGDREPVKRDGEGLLGVHVTVVNPGQDLPETTPITHEIAIEECRLTPPMIDATRGDELVVKNESSFPFVPVLGRGSFGRAVMQGQSRSFPLEQGGVYPLTCGFSAACGRSDVVVGYHSIHTQTEGGGRFRLEGVPVGSRELSAWHPLFRENTRMVEVTEGETIEVTLVLEPTETAEAETASSPDDGEAPNDGEAPGEEPPAAEDSEAG